MKRISYAGGSFLTGDRIADAVLDYAAELANAGRAAKLDVPSLDLEQHLQQVSLVVGPASQMLAEPIALGQELEDPTFTDRLIRLTQVLQSKSGSADGGDSSAFGD